MKTKILTISLLCFLFVQINGQTIETEKLVSALSNLQQDPNSNNQKIYFDLFPNSFESFEKVFGFKNGKAAPLYDGFEYVQALFKLNDIPEKQQIQKWINISIGGHWEADAVNYFQHNLQPRILQNVDLTYELLSKRTSKEIESFFYFFFNQIHPQYESVPTDLKKLQNKDKEFYKLLLSGHKRAIKESGH